MFQTNIDWQIKRWQKSMKSSIELHQIYFNEALFLGEFNNIHYVRLIYLTNEFFSTFLLHFVCNHKADSIVL